MIRRTYACSDCEREFVFECSPDDPDPPCPNPDCDKVLDWRPVSFAIGGSNEGKAAALTYKALEQDYGLSNFRDNARAGDSGIVQRQETKVESEKVEREFHEQVAQMSPEKTAQFWGQNAGSATGMASMTGQSLIQMAKVGPQATIDPIRDLHDRARRGGVSRHPSSMVKEGFKSDMHNPARKQG